jgi:hypothetical protein
MLYRQAERKKALDGLEEWLRERLRRHRGNADMLRQELAIEKAIAVSLRAVERSATNDRRAAKSIGFPHRWEARPALGAAVCRS